MRFVDHQQADAGLLQQLLKLGRRQTLGRAEHDVLAGVFNRLQGLLFVAARQAAVDLGGAGDAGFLQLFRLVLHQRDQRRDHHRHARISRAGNW
jgi:hypothetical protein